MQRCGTYRRLHLFAAYAYDGSGRRCEVWANGWRYAVRLAARSMRCREGEVSIRYVVTRTVRVTPAGKAGVA